MYEAVSPSMRDFILKMCRDGKIIVNEELRELNRELKYQGNNLNQLTRLAHQNRFFLLPIFHSFFSVYRKKFLQHSEDIIMAVVESIPGKRCRCRAHRKVYSITVCSRQKNL